MDYGKIGRRKPKTLVVGGAAYSSFGKVVETYKADKKPEKPHSFGLLGVIANDQRNMSDD
jgi:hypothetical protein